MKRPYERPADPNSWTHTRKATAKTNGCVGRNIEMEIIGHMVKDEMSLLSKRIGNRNGG